ncbi:MAG: arsenate reductase, glutathione/glutaredoxin type [Cyanobacteria bacterium SW_9_44_58]|nr:MAG: arsenate reductase, glutathione/glutaredoxin type [Cyanobacteria bacterium SW_9_44_58]
MAEGFARTLGRDGKINVASAGLEASQVHPTAIQVMWEAGIDISQQTSNSLNEYKPENYNIVVSLCGCGVNLPPEWLTREVFQDWQLDDPDGQSLDTFRRVRDEIKQRVEGLIANDTNA